MNMNTSELKFDKKRARVKSCPCGKSNRDGKFVPFSGHDNEGYCHSCGETFLPELGRTPERIEIPKAKQCSYINSNTFKKSLTHYEANNFAQFLIDKFGKDVSGKVTSRYFIGTTRSGGTVFWQIDHSGKIRSGKIIQYNRETGKRIQEQPPTWVHSALQVRDFNLVQCLFGEHLLKGNSKACAVVESEKTACIASIYFPDLIWLACGGKDGLKASKLQILKGRKVVLFPDLDGFELWSKKAEELRPMLNITVSNLLERKATEHERAGKLDIADYLLRFVPEAVSVSKDKEPEYAFDGTLIDPSKGFPVSWNMPVQSPLERMIKKNAVVADLIKTFDLTCSSPYGNNKTTSSQLVKTVSNSISHK